MGFKYHVIARIDYEKKIKLRKNKEMEFIWRGSKNLENKTDIFTHILYDSYCNPSPFQWENRFSLYNNKKFSYAPGNTLLI
jgi:hypothetical protein